jgi:hypothetical protein
MAAFTVIDHQELSGSASSITKSSISGSYDHLYIEYSLRGTKSNAGSYSDAFLLRFNTSTTSSEYSATRLYASTNTPVSSRPASSGILVEEFPAANALADTFGAGTIWIPNYTNTANFKQAIIQNVFPNNSTSVTGPQWSLSMVAGLFSATPAAITEVKFQCNSASFDTYSSWTIYGVTGA